MMEQRRAARLKAKLSKKQLKRVPDHIADSLVQESFDEQEPPGIPMQEVRWWSMHFAQ
jgi:hypothetical protein